MFLANDREKEILLSQRQNLVDLNGAIFSRKNKVGNHEE